MTEDLAKRGGLPDLVYGDRPSHVHFDPKALAEWRCNSPYCNDMKILHPENGGPVPIIQGYEPWRH